MDDFNFPHLWRCHSYAVTPLRGDPLDGFVDNLNGPFGFFAGILPGVLRVLRIDKRTHLNYTSVDASVKMILAAGWLRGTNQRLNEDPHMTDVINNSCEDVYAETWDHIVPVIGVFAQKATPKCLRAPRVTFTTSNLLYHYKVFTSHVLFGLIVDSVLRVMGMKPRLLSVYRKIYNVNAALLPFALSNYPTKSQKLWKCVSAIKEKQFEPDIRVNLYEEFEPQWNYMSKHILHQKPGNPTIFKLLQVLQHVKNAFKLMLYYWIVWKLLTFLFYRLI